MKNRISFLAIIAIAFGTNCTSASECVGKDCEITPVVLEQEVDKIDILAPKVVETTAVVETCESDCVYDYVCPFATEEECAIWYKKPVA